MTLTLVCFTIIEKMVFQNCKTFWNIIILLITNLHKSILQLECKIVKVTIEKNRKNTIQLCNKKLGLLKNFENNLRR